VLLLRTFGQIRPTLYLSSITSVEVCGERNAGQSRRERAVAVGCVTQLLGKQKKKKKKKEKKEECSPFSSS
jgi:hypothetical protein